jgi:Asp-tRNA(Asn)/Glu-tRNA(Gln) amidotransferase A subunit family amidase
MSASDMADKIKRQEITSEEITEAIIERIEKINPIINAYCTTTFELARELAKKADDSVKKGDKLGLLQGIPISIKDNTETAGIKTTFGCKIFEDNVPMRDEPMVKRIRDAGAVILGKTNTPSFGYKGVTDNLIFGETKNPWNLERTSGGSSGGAGASVASGMGPLATGSDGGGSIRIPSCFCGVYGIKPSFGRIPHETMRLLGTLGTFVNKGPLVRYVKDAALMLDALVGEDDSDRYSIPKPNISYFEKLEEMPKNLKIGYTMDFGYTKAVDPEVRQSTIDSVQKFENMDWEVEKAKLRLTKSENVMDVLWTSGFAYTMKPFLKKWHKALDPEFVEAIHHGLQFTVLDIKMAEIQREQIYETICRFLKKYDILITPTLACPAFELGKLGPDKIDGKDVTVYAWAFTFPFNMSGHPAASIPCGWSTGGLPIGMQIVGKRFDDLTVLQVSRAFEKLAPWQDRMPNFN